MRKGLAVQKQGLLDLFQGGMRHRGTLAAPASLSGHEIRNQLFCCNVDCGHLIGEHDSALPLEPAQAGTAIAGRGRREPDQTGDKSVNHNAAFVETVPNALLHLGGQVAGDDTFIVFHTAAGIVGQVLNDCIH